MCTLFAADLEPFSCLFQTVCISTKSSKTICACYILLSFLCRYSKGKGCRSFGFHGDPSEPLYASGVSGTGAEVLYDDVVVAARLLPARERSEELNKKLYVNHV